MIVNAGANSTDEQIALLVNAINDNLTELRTDIQAQIDQLSNAVNGATFNAVKSIQRGVHAGSNVFDDITITISPVNPDKCIVLFDAECHGTSSSSDNTVRTPILRSLTETKMVVSTSLYYSSGHVSNEFSYQIVEFY